MEQKIQQTENIGMVIGLLKSKDIRTGTSERGNYANGNIVVQVKNEYGVSEIKIDVMQNEKYNNGNDNKAYKSLLTIRDTYKTIKDHGEENADLVQVYVKIDENNYYAKDEDAMRETIRLMATTDFDKGFFTPISRVKDVNAKQTARISFGGFIQDITKKEDGTLDVSMVGATYSGKAIKHKLQVGQELASAFQNTYFVGQSTTLYYVIVNAVELVKAKEEVAFGEGSGMTVEKFTRKNLVVGGSNPHVNGLTQEQVAHMLKIRTVELEEKLEKERAKANNATGNVGFGGATGGFGDMNAGFGGLAGTVNTTVSAGGFGGETMTEMSNPFGMA